jgi:hypothetical protein
VGVPRPRPTGRPPDARETAEAAGRLLAESVVFGLVCGTGYHYLISDRHGLAADILVWIGLGLLYCLGRAAARVWRRR